MRKSQPSRRSCSRASIISRDYQQATSAVLAVISKSPDALQCVLNEIATTVARLCEADFALVFRREGDVGIVWAHNDLAGNPVDGAALIAYLGVNPLPINRGAITGRAIVDRQTIHVEDETKHREWASREASRRNGGQRTVLAVPLLQTGNAIGAITLMRREPRALTPRQITQVETFANQAVIAITNARLFEQVQARAAELRESLDVQTASADILKVISQAHYELQPVLDAVVATGARLRDADRAIIHLRRDDGYRLVAAHGMPAARLADLRKQPVQPDRSSVVGRAILARQPNFWDNALNDDAELTALPKSPDRAQVGYCVPLLVNGEVAGVLTLSRATRRAFTNRQLALARSFADQAVIAINMPHLVLCKLRMRRFVVLSCSACSSPLSPVAGLCGTKSQREPVISLWADARIGPTLRTVSGGCHEPFPNRLKRGQARALEGSVLLSIRKENRIKGSSGVPEGTERPPSKQNVAGSNPAGLANFLRRSPVRARLRTPCSTCCGCGGRRGK